ncbi:MAG: protein tyrosine phosphatase family protein [Gemmatimonadetes bacterium]|nr:protein tyrosine phosphatase family protein [Gemmatimonadota bacterium]
MLALALALQIAAVTGTNTDSVLATARNFVRISDRLATSGQIYADHIAAIAEEGFEVVVNLAPADSQRNGREGFLVAEQGMTYINIPVSWQAPAREHLALFLSVMEANRDRKVFVHCFANMRASAFTYLYRTLVEGVDADEAREYMLAVWDPASDERWRQWDRLIRDAEAGADQHH